MNHRETRRRMGTGPDLRVEAVMAEALAILEPREPYFEIHMGKGTGLDLDASQIMGQVDLLLGGMYALMPVPEADVWAFLT